MNLAGNVKVHTSGRCGQLTLTLGQTTATFDWEYGGGNCIASVFVPTEEEWTSMDHLREYPRAEVLDTLARELIRQQCPGTRPEVSDRFIHLYQPA